VHLLSGPPILPIKSLLRKRRLLWNELQDYGALKNFS